MGAARILLAFALISTFMFCSTAQVRVMPGEDGVNRAVVRDIERDDAESEAVKAANEYCEKRNKQAVFVKDATSYNGKMDEKTRHYVRKGSQAAMILSPVGMAGNEGTAVAGGVLGAAGMVGHSMTNDRDYQSEVVFKCK